MVETEAASVAQSAKQGEFWPNGARLAVSFSLMFEAGGQPISGAGGPVTEPIQNGAPDLPTNSFFEYGFTEGIPSHTTAITVLSNDRERCRFIGG